MSSDYTIQTRYITKRKKPQRCAWCNEMILVGDPAVYRAYIFQGEFMQDYMHVECHEVMPFANIDMADGFEPGTFKRGSVEVDE